MKPVDLGTLLPKSTEVARSQQIEQQRHGTAQQQFGAEVRRYAAEQQLTVRRPEAAQGGRVQRDGRRDPDTQKRERRRALGQTAASPSADPADPSGKDVKGGKGRLLDMVLGGSLGDQGE